MASFEISSPVQSLATDTAHFRSAIAYLSGLIDITTWPGVVVGAGQNSTVRTANGVALQAAFDYCDTNALYAYHPGGVLEYIASGTQGAVNTGLQLKKGARGLLGQSAQTCVFIQFATNFPALTLGDVSATPANATALAKYDGFSVGFGTSQAGQTSGIGLLLGRIYLSEFGIINVSGLVTGSRVEAYQGIATPSNTFFYGNVLKTISVDTGLQNQFLFQATCTGNVWDQMIFGSGTFGNEQVSASNAISINNCAHFGTVNLLNMEWQKGTDLLLLNNVGGFTCTTMRMEGNRLAASGFGPCFIKLTASQATFGAIEGYNNQVATGDISGGTAVLFSAFGDSKVTVDSNVMLWNQAGNSQGVQTATYGLFAQDSGSGGHSHVSVKNGLMAGNTGTFNPDANLTAAVAGVITAWGEYIWNPGLSTMDRAFISAPSANTTATVYGCTPNARVVVDGAITADKKIIWKNTCAPSGFGASLPTPARDTLEVFRDGNATGAFNVNIRDDGDTTTVIAAATANTTKRVARSGTTLVGF